MKRLLILLAFCGALICSAGCDKPDNPKPSPGPDKPVTPTDPTTPTDPPAPPATPFFTADIKDVYPFNRANSGVEIHFQTNIQDITVTPDSAWCKVTLFAQQSYFLMMVDAYDTRLPNGAYDYPEPRTCSVTVKAGDVYNKTFKVLQEGHTYIRVPESPVVLSAAGASTDVKISTNCYEIQAVCDASWLSFNIKDMSTVTVTSTARPDSEKTPRKATVRLVSKLDSDTYNNFVVADADATLSDEDYKYGDHTDWD